MRVVRLILLGLLAPPVAALAFICAGGAVASQLGRWSNTADIFSHFTLIWLIGSIVAMAMAFIFSGALRWTLFAWSLIGALSSLTLMAPEYLRDTGPKAPDAAPGQIKLVQFNGWYGNEDFGRIFRWLEAQKADVVVLQELDMPFYDLALKWGGWHAVTASGDVIVMSRKPAHLGEVLRVEGDLPAKLTVARIGDGASAFTVIGVHNTWPTEVKMQQAQEARLARLIAKYPPDRLIVSGDFNSTPWSFSRQRWDKRFGLVRRERAFYSWPIKRDRGGRTAPFPLLPIDHVYAGKGWATVKIERGPNLGSDHVPLVVTLAPVSPP